MADLTAVLVPCFVIFSVGILIFLYCYCTSDGRQLYNRLLHGENRGGPVNRVVVIKKSEQSNVKGIESRIIDKLRQDLSRNSLNLTEKQWTPDQATEHTPVIVFCVYASRLGVDIESAVRGLPGDALIVLVILHPHNIISQMPRDLSDEEDLLDVNIMRRMSGGIAHFGFSDRAGLYDCRQNDGGHRKLLDCVTVTH